VLAEYDGVAARTGIQRARIAHDLATGASRRAGHIEDGLARLLAECAQRSPFERVQSVLPPLEVRGPPGPASDEPLLEPHPARAKKHRRTVPDRARPIIGVSSGARTDSTETP
jgi:hypothetical protein